jgi:DNA-binding MarR family transcriptional regulator
MSDFETNLNTVLTDTFNSILKYEETSLKTISSIPVTVTEVHIIETIAKKGDSTTVSEIASSLGIAASTATVAIKKLVSKGFVSKVPCAADGRRSIITLTEFGKRVDRAHSIFHRKMVRNISSGFSDEEKSILLNAVNKLSVFFKKKVEA